MLNMLLVYMSYWKKWIDHDQPGLISSQVYSKSEINSYLNKNTHREDRVVNLCINGKEDTK